MRSAMGAADGKSLMGGLSSPGFGAYSVLECFSDIGVRHGPGRAAHHNDIRREHLRIEYLNIVAIVMHTLASNQEGYLVQRMALYR